MNNILYQFNPWDFSFLAIPLLPIAGFSFFPTAMSAFDIICQYQKNKYENTKFHKNNKFHVNTENIKFIWKTLSLFLIIGLCFTVIGICARMVEYNKIYDAVKNNTYMIVEGYVENFEPEKYFRGNDPEHFEINGVRFAYSEAISACGYNRTYGHNGAIRENGQHLKIGYISMGHEGMGNIIVYIEQLDDEVPPEEADTSE